MSPRTIRILLIALAALSVPEVLVAQTTGVLAAPTGVEASDGAYSTKVGINWDAVRDAAHYQVLRGASANAASAGIVGVTPSLTFYDTSAEPGRTYYYWVRAADGNLQSGLSQPDAGFRAPGRENFDPTRLGPLPPPEAPVENPLTGAKIYLGKALFWDEQLSSTRTVACGTCHRPRNGGSDPRSVIGSERSTDPGADGTYGTDDDIVGSPGVPTSRSDGIYELSPVFGLREQVTPRKAQSAIDAAYSRLLFWDGRVGPELEDPLTGQIVIAQGAALESQALAPLVEPLEMGHEGVEWGNVVARIAASKPLALSPALPPALTAWLGGRGYPELFAEAFGSPEITPVRIAMAIASYERTLYSDRTPFDRMISEIIEEPPEIRRGRDVFVEANCHECHGQALFSDNRFHYIGLRPAEEDRGRSKVTGELGGSGKFRAPSLRNVALRAPYMHNGRFATLEEVIEFYDRGGDFHAPHLNRNFIRRLQLTLQQKSDLIGFLHTLTDPRVAAEAGPVFDRPMLYSESARVPQVIGDGSAGAGGSVPQVVAIEPPIAGNPSFTVGMFGAPEGTRTVLVVDEADPGAGPQIPGAASFFRTEVPVEGEGATGGHASVSLPIPNDPSLIGKTLFGRWFVVGDSGGVSATPAFRMTIFGAGGPGPMVSPFSCVSAASLAIGVVAPQSLVSGYGDGLSTSTEAASSAPPPTALAGAHVLVRDSAGSERLAPLLYASPHQINYQIPSGTAPGEAVVAVLRGGATVASGTLQVAPLAPALFAANSDGRDTAAALVLRVSPGGSSTYEPVALFDQTAGRFVSAPINLSRESDEVFLVLFGTGIRGNSGLAGVAATIGGELAEVLYAGEQGEFAGVDQINLRIPGSLAGRGEVDVVVRVDGEACNTVRVQVK